MRTSVSCTYGVCEMNCGGVKTLEIGSASPSFEEVVVMGCGRVGWRTDAGLFLQKQVGLRLFSCLL